MTTRIIAVVPTYLPSTDVMANIARIRSQVDAVIVVDDGSPEPSGSDAVLAQIAHDGSELVRLTENRGIAHALNVGIRIALERGADFVLTVDQDTLLPHDYAARLLDTFALASSNAAPLQTRIGVVASERVNDTRLRIADTVDGVATVVEAIQSGSLVSAHCLRECGWFDERLVIDTVDTEFCLRISLHGFAVAIAPGSRIEHAIGTQSPVRVFGIPIRRRGQAVVYPHHSPYRRYFITRNNIDLWFRYARRRPAWTALSIRREVLTGVLTIVSGPDRPRQLLGALVGGWHGLIRRRGEMSPRLRRRLRH